MQFDLGLSLQEDAGAITAELEYASDLFDRSTVERWAGYFQTALAGMVLDLQRPSIGRVTFSSLMPRSSAIICAAGQDGDILEHRLAAIAEAGRLDGGHLQAAAQLVDDQRRQRLALDVLGDDGERLAGLHHRLENRESLLGR